jgi:hypothetical protein
MTRKVLLLCATTVAGLLFATGSAMAITLQTNITSPANQTVLSYDEDNGAAPGNKITVTGTSNIISGTVDINCYFGGGTSANYAQLISSVATDGSGNFSTGAINWIDIVVGLSCVLRAVPGGSTPSGQEPGSTTTNFLGPILRGGAFGSSTISGSSVPENNGKVYDYGSHFGQMKGAVDYSSLGDCGLTYSVVYGPDLAQAENGLFGCSAYFTAGSMKVDGTPAFNPSSAANRSFPGASCCPSSMNVVGLPNLTRSWSVEPTTANVTIQETDPLVFYNAASGTYVTAGVQVQRTISQDADGLRSTIADHWSSTDGKAHAVKLVYLDSFYAISNTPAFRFPWVSGNPGYSTPSGGDPVPAPPWAVTYFYRKSGSLADGDPRNLHAAVMLSSPPDAMVFGSTGRRLISSYARTVPATGTLDLTFIYAGGFSDAQTSALVLAQQDAFSGPVVKFTAPPDGTVLATPNVTLTGTAADNVGLASFQLNGADVPVAATGDWSKAVVLKPGPNTFTAVAKDGAGNTTQAVETVTYAPDVTGPKIGVVLGKLSLKKLLASGGLTETVSCDEPCNIAASLTIDAKAAKKLHVSKVLTIAAGKGSLTAPGKVAVVVKLKPKALKALRKAKPKALRLILGNVATDNAGNATTATKALNLRGGK